MTLGYLIALLVIAGIIVFLVKRAPFIDAEWKTYISYGVLVIVALFILRALFGGTAPFSQVHIGR